MAVSGLHGLLEWVLESYDIHEEPPASCARIQHVTWIVVPGRFATYRLCLLFYTL